MKQPILLGTSAFPLEAFLSSRIYSSLGSGILAAEVRQIPRAIALALCLLLPTSCATTDELRFPLTFPGAMEVTARRETALQAFPAYQRMGDDQMRLGHLVGAAIAYKNAGQAALTLGRLQMRWTPVSRP